jgi:hypothetical protein
MKKPKQVHLFGLSHRTAKLTVLSREGSKGDRPAVRSVQSKEVGAPRNEAKLHNP